MKACGAVLVLLSCLSEAGAQTGESRRVEEKRESCVVEPAGACLQPDVYAELKELRDMAVEQRVQLRNLEPRVAASEGEVRDQRDKVCRLDTTVAEQREKLKNLEGEAKELRNVVTDLRVELRVTKNEMERMAKENAEMAARLSASESKVEDVTTRLGASESKVLDLSDKVLGKQREDKPKVAPHWFNSGTTLVYKRVINNICNAYNQTTGPVKGVYDFRFTESSTSPALQMSRDSSMLILIVTTYLMESP